jgi:hypothetical protein
MRGEVIGSVFGGAYVYVYVTWLNVGCPLTTTWKCCADTHIHIEGHGESAYDTTKVTRTLWKRGCLFGHVKDIFEAMTPNIGSCYQDALVWP